MKELINEKKFGIARLLSRTSRYIDDICVLNYKHLNSILCNIYPSDLIAERSGVNNKTDNYLDVNCSHKYEYF